MNIIYHEQGRVFHLFNDSISYILMVLPHGGLGSLYFGAALRDREGFEHLFERAHRGMTACVFADSRDYSLDAIRQELPTYGSSDFRRPALNVLQENGSRILDLQFKDWRVEDGKPKLAGLPATYVESPSEAKTLIVTLEDVPTGLCVELLYTIFAEGNAIARSMRCHNAGMEMLHLQKVMSLSIDLPDTDYEWLELTGAWARERHVERRALATGITAIGSRRGHSSGQYNPFVALVRPETTEMQGEVLAVSLVYSGNFEMLAEVDNHGVTRLQAGIHSTDFDWTLATGETFQTPEAVLVWSDEGLNGMSRTCHRLYQRRLARGTWRDKVRPILINNWEATYFDFTEEKLLAIADVAAQCGVELFVLDDGWFGARTSDHAGLGDWTVNPDRLPNGIDGLAEKIEARGMKFGIWVELEMVNEDSDLYRAHPDWVLSVPGRRKSLGRSQCVLDFSRQDVVDNIYAQMAAILASGKVSYVKWDMNRSITECWSHALPAARQGEVFHRYILGLYDLYERLTTAFPHVLFESCASGGNRFDPGMLYYAPQAWTSDNSDAVERQKIQYGTSMCYPLSSMGSHVSVVPNHQVNRVTPLHTRANTAYFGTFGYELDLGKLSAEEIAEVKDEIAFMKEYREIFQFGTFYRLQSPFEHNVMAWMCVSGDQKTAIVGWYRTLNRVNDRFARVRLAGLLPDTLYEDSRSGTRCYGDELMHYGLITTDGTTGEPHPEDGLTTDFDSRLYVLNAVE